MTVAIDPTETVVASQPHRVPKLSPQKRPMLCPETQVCLPDSRLLNPQPPRQYRSVLIRLSTKYFPSRRDAMPIYISRGRFTSGAIKGMLAKPENREEAVAKLFKSVGGRLIGWYLTFGHHDWLAIGEFPDEKAAASAILAAAAGGSLSDIETTVAMTAKDAHSTFVSAGTAAKGFRSAGRS
jgi:uncharacterized protein with GYD domain